MRRPRKVRTAETPRPQRAHPTSTQEGRPPPPDAPRPDRCCYDQLTSLVGNNYPRGLGPPPLKGARGGGPNYFLGLSTRTPKK